MDSKQLVRLCPKDYQERPHREFSVETFAGLTPGFVVSRSSTAAATKRKKLLKDKDMLNYLALMTRESAMTPAQAAEFQSYVDIGVWTGPPPRLEEPALWASLLDHMRPEKMPAPEPYPFAPNLDRAACFKQRFLDKNLMRGPPRCTQAAFKTPRLRRCPFDVASIDWKRTEPLTWGFDGFIWKIWLKNDGPYVLKMASTA